ncbi:MAG: rhomboid family intramembrane serine protease [Phycisphaerae bacterium]|nr:rhomboid family intramembrane serine protease [Phycisphaerae bacterium]
MGIYERDYAGNDGGGAGAWRGLFGGWSFTNWLIGINVAVFVIGALLQRPVEISFGRVPDPAATREQLKRGVVRHEILRQHPTEPGVFYHPIYDLQTARRDESGRILIDPRSGQPMPVQVGIERAVQWPALRAWGHFSSGKAFFELQVWRFVTFQFLHASLTHLLFNMLGLWFFGPLVEQYLGAKRFAAFYLVTGIFGALAYLVLNTLGYIGISLPGVLFDDPYTPLVGASAGVFGVLVAAAFIAPRAIIQVFFVIPMQLRAAVLLFIGIAAVNLLMQGRNAGGDAAHVGGAFAGWFFIRRMHLLRDFFDVFGDSRKAPDGGGRRRPGGLLSRMGLGHDGAATQAEVDRILAKVSAQGLQSLTEREKRTLRRASEAGRGG